VYYIWPVLQILNRCYTSVAHSRKDQEFIMSGIKANQPASVQATQPQMTAKSYLSTNRTLQHI